jgi:hypothetical protein
VQVTIEVDDGQDDALESEGFAAIVPPPVSRASRQTYCFSWTDSDAAAIDPGREDARYHPSLFVLEMVNVQGRALPVRRQGSLHFETHSAVLRDASQNKTFTRMSILEYEIQIG